MGRAFDVGACEVAIMREISSEKAARSAGSWLPRDAAEARLTLVAGSRLTEETACSPPRSRPCSSV